MRKGNEDTRSYKIVQIFIQLQKRGLRQIWTLQEHVYCISLAEVELVVDENKNAYIK